MDENKLLSRLQNQCSRREYCTADIKKKIDDAARKEGIPSSPSVADRLLKSLKADGYLSDSRYAVAFARDKSSLSGWGPAKIRFALAAKGITKLDIEHGIAEIDADSALPRMQKTLQTKYNAIKEDPQWKLKLIRFGLSRGYSYDDVEGFIAGLK